MKKELLEELMKHRVEARDENGGRLVVPWFLVQKAMDRLERYYERKLYLAEKSGDIAAQLEKIMEEWAKEEK